MGGHIGYTVMIMNITMWSIAIELQRLQRHSSNKTKLLVNNMLNKNTLGVKKVRGQLEAALQTGAHSQVTKPIIVVKICYKLLYVIQVVKNIFDK